MEQMQMFEDKKRNSGYMKSRNNNAEFTPTFTDKKFVAQFDAYCRRNHLQKTATLQKWMIERLNAEIKEELNNMSREELIERLLEEQK